MKIPLAYKIDDDWRGLENHRSGLLEFITYIKSLGITRLVEIGSYLGDSTVLFAEHMEYVYSVDPYKSGYDKSDAASFKYDMFDVECNFLKRTSKFSNVVKMKMTGEQASYLFEDGSLELAYIDPNHQYQPTADELRRWLKKIKPGMYISGHDYGIKDFPGVKQAVDEILGGVDKTFQDYSWIKQV